MGKKYQVDYKYSVALKLWKKDPFPIKRPLMGWRGYYFVRGDKDGTGVGCSEELKNVYKITDFHTSTAFESVDLESDIMICQHHKNVLDWKNFNKTGVSVGIA